MADLNLSGTVKAEQTLSGSLYAVPGETGGGAAGKDGGYYTPSVTQPDDNTMRVSYTPSDSSMPAVESQNVTLPAGPAGADGAPGSDGAPGADGKSAYQYAQEGGYTGTEAEFAAKLAAEFPDKLPNPNTLTFSGAVTGTYDGSAPLSVEIPSGGGGSGETVTGKLLCKLVGDGVSSEVSQTFDETTMPDGLYYMSASYGTKTDAANQNIYVKIGGSGIFGAGARGLYLAGNNNQIKFYGSAFFAIAQGIVFFEHININGNFINHLNANESGLNEGISRTISIYSQTSHILTEDTSISVYRVM